MPIVRLPTVAYSVDDLLSRFPCRHRLEALPEAVASRVPGEPDLLDVFGSAVHGLHSGRGVGVFSCQHCNEREPVPRWVAPPPSRGARSAP